MCRRLLLGLLLLLPVPLLCQAQQFPSVNQGHPLRRDLVAWWRALPGLTGGNTFYDLSGRFRHGTLTGMGFSATSGWSATTRPGGYAQVNFDGSNDYVETSGTAGLVTTSAFSLCAWVNPTTNTGGPVLLTTAPEAGAFDGIWWQSSRGGSGKLALALNDGAGNATIREMDTPLALGTWTHVCTTHDGSGATLGIVFYRNGGLAASTEVYTNPLPIPWTDRSWRLGADKTAATADMFTGAMDDVRVYTRVLTATEVQALYTQSLQGDPALLVAPPSPVAMTPAVTLPPGLVLALTCDETSGNALDSSGLNNTATATGGATHGPGKFGNGCVCDGVNDYFVVGNETNFDFEWNQPFSLAVWVKPTTADTTVHHLLSKQADSTPYRGWVLSTNIGAGFANDPGKLMFRVWSTPTTVALTVRTTNDTLVNDGAWHQYVVTYSGSGAASGVVLYEDGSPVPLTTMEDLLGPTSTLNNQAVGVCARSDGAPTNGEFFNGTLDEVRIYNRALDAGEVATLFAYIPPTVDLTTGLALYLTCDEASGNAADSSGLNNTATATGGATHATGKSGFGNACLCDGTNDYFVISNEATFDFEWNMPFSLALWLKPNTADTTAQVLLSKQPDSGVFRGWAWLTNFAGTNDPGKMAFMLVNTYATNKVLVQSFNDTLMNDGSWHHYVWTYSGSGTFGGVKLYQDGVSLATGQLESSLASATILNDTPVGLCARGDGSPNNLEFYNGSVDEVRIYTRELSANEVGQLAAFTPVMVAQTRGTFFQFFNR